MGVQNNLGSILVLAPRGRDASVIAQVLFPLGLPTVLCGNLKELVGQLDELAVCAVVTEETLLDDGVGDLQDWIRNQPQWSDFPFVVLATKQVGRRHSDAAEALANLGNEILLERPLNAETLISSVKSARRSRGRQYETRDHLELQQEIVTENRRLYEAERVALAEAEAANTAKDEFLATLSHELRTPLSAILGWTYILQRRREELGTLARGVDIIERNAKAQARLIEDLLDMSRIVAGKISLELEPVVAALLIDQVIATVTPNAQAKGVTIDRDLSDDLVPVLADSHRLQQVLWNLVTNAVKFTDSGGRVVISAKVEGSEIAFSVRDTGAGIGADFLPQVFERFRQADGSTTRSHGGLGLGLSIVKRITELHGGSVSAFSAGLGQGSTFTVRVPVVEYSPGRNLRRTTMGSGPSPQDYPPASAIEGVRVLLVEDDSDGREMIAHVLTESGGKVSSVDSARSALQELAKGDFDVVISDIGMPDVDGYELIQLIRAKGYLTPAIALTAFARDEDRERALGAGFNSHLTKPVEPLQLIDTLAKIVASNS